MAPPLMHGPSTIVDGMATTLCFRFAVRRQAIKSGQAADAATIGGTSFATRLLMTARSGHIFCATDFAPVHDRVFIVQ